MFWDMAGRRLIDMHLNGGTYNLGHRNPEVMAAVVDGMERFDIGNHHFPSLARTALAEARVDELLGMIADGTARAEHRGAADAEGHA